MRWQREGCDGGGDEDDGWRLAAVVVVGSGGVGTAELRGAVVAGGVWGRGGGGRGDGDCEPHGACQQGDKESLTPYASPHLAATDPQHSPLFLPCPPR